MDNNLACLICYGEFKDPRVLDCGHCFCFECILKCDIYRIIACPECRVETKIMNKLPKMVIEKPQRETGKAARKRRRRRKKAEEKRLLMASIMPNQSTNPTAINFTGLKNVSNKKKYGGRHYAPYDLQYSLLPKESNSEASSSYSLDRSLNRKIYGYLFKGIFFAQFLPTVTHI